MAWEVAFIIWLQSFSSQFLDYIAYFFTLFGDQLFFILFLSLVYWCLDKDKGFEFFIVYLSGSVINEGVKYIFQRPRPYVKYADKIRSIIKDTKGYSFPSGHSQSIVNISTQAIMYGKKEKKKILPMCVGFFALIGLVMLSRVYLGQHYPTDVAAGAILGLCNALIFSKLYGRFICKYRYKCYSFILPACILITVILLCFNSTQFKAAIEVCGALSGFSLGFSLEKKYIGYKVRADKHFKYPLRFITGIVVVVVLKLFVNLLCSLTDYIWVVNLFDGFAAYFILTLWISFLAPLVFSLFNI